MDFTNNGFKLPIIILGYEPRKLFSVSDASGRVMIPIFSNAEYARNYQLHFRSIQHDGILTFVMTEYDKVINLFETIQIVDPMAKYVAIDPMPPTKKNRTEKVQCYTVDEYIKKLKGCRTIIKKRYGLTDPPAASD